MVRRGEAWEGHLPLWLGIAAAGAGMVSLVEHAGDSRTPTATAWLIGAAVVSLLLGALRPTPVILALALNLTLGAVWMEAFFRHASGGTLINEH